MSIPWAHVQPKQLEDSLAAGLLSAEPKRPLWQLQGHCKGPGPEPGPTREERALNSPALAPKPCSQGASHTGFFWKTVES